MLIGRTPRFCARAFARSRRKKLSSLYQQRTSSGSERSSGRARPVKKPRAWLDQGNSAIPVFVNHARDAASEALRQPAHTGSTMRAELKLLLSATKPVIPCCFAQAFAASMRLRDQFEPPKARTRP